MKQKSVKGLENIGKLVVGAALTHAPRPVERDMKQAIIDKTMGAMLNSLDTSKPHVVSQVGRILAACVREAFNAGHAQALVQNDMVEVLLKKQFDTRTKLTLPVAVMAIMEQSGMSSMLLDLEAVATINQRCRVELQSVEDEDDKMHMLFTLRSLSDDAAPDNNYALAP